MNTIILANRGKEIKIIEEEKEEWIYQVLVALGVEENFLVESSNEDVIEYCKSIQIEVIKNLGEETVTILKSNKIIAEWNKPSLLLKKDKDGFFYEIHLNEWALPFQQMRKGDR